METNTILLNVVLIGGLLFCSYQAYKIGRSRHGLDCVRRFRKEINPRTEAEVKTLIKVVDIMTEEV